MNSKSVVNLSNYVFNNTAALSTLFQNLSNILRSYKYCVFPMNDQDVIKHFLECLIFFSKFVTGDTYNL